MIQARARAWRVGIPRTKKEIARWAKHQRDRILAIVEPKRTLQDLEQDILDYDFEKDGAALAGIAAAFHFTMTEAAAEHLDAFGVATTFGGRGDPAVERVLHAITNRPDGVRLVQGRVKAAVLEEVRHGMALGATFRDIANGGTILTGPVADRFEVEIKGIRGVYNDLETWQAQRIARTEAAVGYNRSSAALMRDVGVQYVYIIDGTDDDECAEANGSRWTVDEYDSNPISHPNCTRLGLPVV